MFATASPAYLSAPVGETVSVEVSIGNVSSLIDGYTVRVFGLDAHWVHVSTERLSLFPGAIEPVRVDLQLPDDFPAGPRQISIHVQSENDPTVFEIATVTVDVASRPRLAMTVDPVSVAAGSAAQFGLVVANTGNSILDVYPGAVDPEDRAEFTFDPAAVHLLPGEQAVIQAGVKAPRPWFGQPSVRVLTFSANSPERVESVATFVQRPRIGRWMMSLLGLLTAAAVFAAVLSHTLSDVVDEASVGDNLINQALANEDEASAGARVPVDPATVKGAVVSASTGEGIAGVQAELFTAKDPVNPIASAATADDGSFAFGRLGGGTFRVRFTGAGFTETWYGDVSTFRDAADVDVPAGETVELPPMTLGGRPGSIAGAVIGDDITGAKATLVVAGFADPDTPAVVASVDVSVDGSFLLEKLPSPAEYQLVVERPGSATETRDVVLGPGEAIEGIEIRLRAGGGLISGRVTAGGVALGGATIEATDGTTTIQTVSLTDGDVGAFVVRNLAVPGRYTVTVQRNGFTPESRTIVLSSTEPVSAEFALSPAVGSISGTVTEAGGGLLGGVTVSVTGPAIEASTSTISQGEGIGTYVFDPLPAPGTYTITFSKPGYVSQVRLVEVNPISRTVHVTGVDMTLIHADGVVTGQVLDASGAPVAGAEVTLNDGVTSRTLRTAHEPLGAFTFSNVAPGSYTVTASLIGASDVVQVIDVRSGEIETLQLQLGVQASLTGQVVSGNGTPLANMSVRLYSPLGFPTAGLLTTTVTDENGFFTFANVGAPDDYVVAVFANASSVDALDSELVQSVPGTAVVVPTFVVNPAGGTTTTTSSTTTTTTTVPTTTPDTTPG